MANSNPEPQCQCTCYLYRLLISIRTWSLLIELLHHVHRLLSILPNAMFNAFYIGIVCVCVFVGPYLLGFGTLLFMFSKEIVLFDHNIAEVYAFTGAMFYIWYKLHKKLNVMMDLDSKVGVSSSSRPRTSLDTLAHHHFTYIYNIVIEHHDACWPYPFGSRTSGHSDLLSVRVMGQSSLLFIMTM